MDKEFQIRFLDHVAITVKDLKLSADWYQKVLNLTPYTFEEWGAFPIFMMSGKTGLALFPAKGTNQQTPDIRIHHFAFNVDQANFDLAKDRLKSLGVPYQFQDHHYFHSIYLNDPDGHQVELTTIQVPEERFYR